MTKHDWATRPMLLRSCMALAILASIAAALLAGVAQFGSLLIQLLRLDDSGELMDLGIPRLRVPHQPFPD